VQLFVFSVTPGYVRDAVAAGIHGAVVDWELRGKARRQAGHDTQINRDTPADLSRVRQATTGRVLCRINSFGPWTAGEIADAIARGADELLLPMVRTVEQVDRTLELVDDRCGLGILIETLPAVAAVPGLATRPLSRIYVGLNDLRIARGSSQLFEPLIDGTVDRVRTSVEHIPFGVAGLTRPDAGWPLPCRLLLAELARLGTDFTFLRRSFLADTVGRDLSYEVPRLLDAVRQARGRLPDDVRADRDDLVAALREPQRALQPA
jgi:hypothetical protein